MSEIEHSLDVVFFDVIGDGWRIRCSCGWVSCPDRKMGEAGAEFDEHMEGKPE